MIQRHSDRGREGAAQSEPTLRAPWAHSKLTRLTAFAARFGLVQRLRMRSGRRYRARHG
jgi:hypothetical protein